MRAVGNQCFAREQPHFLRGPKYGVAFAVGNKGGASFGEPDDVSVREIKPGIMGCDDGVIGHSFSQLGGAFYPAGNDRVWIHRAATKFIMLLGK
jgi:hypothetical protein